MNDMRTAVDVVWQSLPQAIIDELMPRRIDACIAAQFGHNR